LDLGCGNKSIIEEYRALGYEAFGCDFAFIEGLDVEILRTNELIRLIEESLTPTFHRRFLRCRDL
jgi:hypothetical protein